SISQGVVPQLRFAGARHDASDESGESGLSGTGDWVCGAGGLCAAAPGGMAREAERAGRATGGGVSLPATGRADRTETGSQEGDAGGVASTSGVPDSETDSGVGADSDGTDPVEGTQPASVSEQAAVLGLLWIGGGDAVECGLSFSRGTGGEAAAGTDDAGGEPELQSSAQGGIEECGAGRNPSSAI